MNKASLSQRINPKNSPPFWEMDDSTFEHFSRSLMHEDEHIKYAELYGLRGEKQYGIDIEAERKDGGIDVGQCKCCKAFSHRQISKAAAEFIKYWDEVWGSRDVRRFILLVACELSSKKQRDEIAKWKKKFAQIGVEFEAWSNDVIRDKLRPHRGIVTDYLGDSWAIKICGQSLRGATPKSSSEITVSADAKLERFTAIANSSAQKELDQINSLISSGKAASALRQLDSLKSDDSLWSLLEKETQAKVLRIEGALRLEESDGLHSAKSLADEAEKLFKPDGPSQLRALIAWKEKGFIRLERTSLHECP